MLKAKEIHVDELVFTIHATQLKSSQPFLLTVKSENLDIVLASGIAVTSVNQALLIAKDIIATNINNIRLELTLRAERIINFERQWNDVDDILEAGEYSVC